MVSKTRMQELVKAHKHREVQAALAESPELLRFRDKKRAPAHKALAARLRDAHA